MADGGLMDTILGLGFIWQIEGHDYKLVVMTTLKEILELIQYHRA